MKDTVVELVIYKLKNGISKAQLDELQVSLNEYLLNQDGFMYRSCSEDKEGTIYDVAYWQNDDCVKKASAGFCSSEAGQALMSLVCEDSVVMHHMPLLSEAMPENCSELA